MSTEPPIVTKARELMAAHQAGRGDLAAYAAGVMNEIIPIYEQAMEENDERTIEYCAPQIAALADRIGWLRAKK